MQPGKDDTCLLTTAPRIVELEGETIMNTKTFLLVAVLAMAPFALSVCGGCPTTATCPQDGGRGDYDDMYEENGVVYCAYVHHVQSPSGPRDHRFRVVCR